jgi:enamine deaminase RidA (YjgF/YER057c/UK114 family)
MLHVEPVNPWTWQDSLGFSQAFEVSGHGRVLFCSGQTSVDVNGSPLHPGDMSKQLSQAFDNLEAVLTQAGMTLANVVRLNYYTTDVPAFLNATPMVVGRLGGAKPPGSLLGVASLFHPDILIEIEATAVG